ncbi:MAG: SlyX family protein [Bacteroidia bacterium]|nr:SlyX family protein [Bacteroidia bacterium]MCX7763952.1 SlyX family protein [Bacteroidia bacterium]MDW8057157.1 hypothetical protein [Bacteroidia bacterium]
MIWRKFILTLPALILVGCCGEDITYNAEKNRLEVELPLASGAATGRGGLWVRFVPSGDWGYAGQFQVEGPHAGNTKALAVTTMNEKGEHTDRFVVYGDGRGIVYGPFDFTAPITVKEIIAKDTARRWPDYVLSPSYRLRSLKELQQFIATHGHLPGLPSAQQVAAQGVPLFATQQALVEKVEELSLYVIDLQRQIDSLQRQLQAYRQ